MSETSETSIPTTSSPTSSSHSSTSHSSTSSIPPQTQPPPRTGTLLYYLRSNWRSLLLGQILSILLATAGAAQSTLHLSCNLSAPTFGIGLVYIFLSLHLFSLRRYRDRVPLVTNDGGTDKEQNASADESIQQDVADVAVNKNNRFNAILRISPQPTHKFLCGLPLHAPPWIYLIMAFLDVEANYLTVLAYRYTTLTSISLFDALAIPSAMILSRCLLTRKYGKIHLLGVTICMVGVVANVLQDYKSDEESQQQDNASSAGDNDDGDANLYPHRIRGDVLAVIGGMMYGINDTLCELSVRTMGFSSEFLGAIGLFAGIISIVQAAVVERDDIRKFFELGSVKDELQEDGTGTSSCTALAGWGLLLSFVLVNVISYSGAARFLLLSEAAFFNLSLLTGDLWTVVFSIFAQRIVPGPLFFVALSLIVGGVCVYEMAPSPVATTASSSVNKEYDQGRGMNSNYETLEMTSRVNLHQSHELI